MLQKLTVIVGEIEAGITSVKMRNMGQSILDALLSSKILTSHNNKDQLKSFFQYKGIMERE